MQFSSCYKVCPIVLDGIASMAEQIASCMKKKPVVKVFKMIREATPNEQMMTPEKPITLKLDMGSSDDEYGRLEELLIGILKFQHSYLEVTMMS